MMRNMNIYDTFSRSINPRWVQVCTGGGLVHLTNSKLRMGFSSSKQSQYTDVQIDDYTMLSRSNYAWRPPLRLIVRARSSLPAATSNSTNKSKGILRGTGGFGFWNNPFSVKGKILALPESIWFFYAAPPSNIALVPGISGWGWKAQVIHSMRIGSLASIIPTAVTTVFARLTGEIRPASKWIQRLTGAREALLPVDMTKWHTYTLEWRYNQSLFWVDGKLVLDVPLAPSRNLGFVAWLDNQYAIATPQGILRFGTIASGEQWLEMDSLKIERI